MRKREKGITLIALVITIIVLLILAGVSIAMLTGQNGILNQANSAKIATEEARKKEENDLKKIENYMDLNFTVKTEATENGWKYTIMTENKQIEYKKKEENEWKEVTQNQFETTEPGVYEIKVSNEVTSKTKEVYSYVSNGLALDIDIENNTRMGHTDEKKIEDLSKYNHKAEVIYSGEWGNNHINAKGDTLLRTELTNVNMNATVQTVTSDVNEEKT